MWVFVDLVKGISTLLLVFLIAITLVVGFTVIITAFTNFIINAGFKAWEKYARFANKIFGDRW